MLAKTDFFILCLAWITMAQLLAQDEKKNAALKDQLSRIDLDGVMKKDEPPLIFPKTLEEFEYAFNERGQLRHTKTGEPFVFNYKEDMHRWNQKRYEALGEIITQYVYELLEKDCKLRKEMLPVDATESEPKSFIYMSEDALTNQDKLLVLIHGNGVVRAGQWARRLIINEGLDSGTQIPFINRAMKEGYGVIVLNPNENELEVEKVRDPSADMWDEPAEKRERKEECEGKKKKDGNEKYRNPQKECEKKRIPIRENSSPEEHTLYVWDHFISRSRAKNIFVVAHSYGGLSFVELMIQREDEVMSRVSAVAMTDSVHNVWHQEPSRSIREWLQERCCNWVSNPEPLDTPVDSLLPDCRRRSAGTEKHELTSWNSFKSIFKFFNEHLQAQMEEDGDAGNVEEEKEEKVKKVEEEPKEERRDEPKEEQREEQKEKHGEELNEEQKEEVEDGSTVMTTHQKAKHEDL
ncbi:cotranscriptional regulator FAM172A homolog [Clarias gariepinus]|nr:cotranscriptional regulator FAM172A homolog [Clarias gariepinus]XP_053336535.1 cotranscriptional regulator FAM172A homolog [Clarias gariepinus]XP_053336536.1 cotranscriptional regulator FAM172A homolog [Clarias gariepinus]